MSITTVTSLQPPLFLNPTNHCHHPFYHRLTTPTTTSKTLTFPIKPITSPPLKLTLTHPPNKPYLLKPRSTLLPINPVSPTEAISIFLSFSKELSAKLSVSVHEFKVPLLALANAAGKWVDLYHSVLIVRILLSWFPNMPWEKQPFSAIRDLCDPCLSFFRSIMPPNSNKKIDVSPLLAFVFFGVLSSFLKTAVQPPI